MVYNILSVELFRRRDRVGCLAETVKISLSFHTHTHTRAHKYIIHLSCTYAAALVGRTGPDGDGRLAETYSGVKFALNYVGGPRVNFSLSSSLLAVVRQRVVVHSTDNRVGY